MVPGDTISQEIPEVAVSPDAFHRPCSRMIDAPYAAEEAILKRKRIFTKIVKQPDYGPPMRQIEVSCKPPGQRARAAQVPLQPFPVLPWPVWQAVGEKRSCHSNSPYWRMNFYGAGFRSSSV